MIKLFRSSISLLIFCLLVLYIIETRVLKFLTTFMVSLFLLTIILVLSLVFWSSVIRCIDIYGLWLLYALDELNILSLYNDILHPKWYSLMWNLLSLILQQWIDERTVVLSTMDYYSAIKRNELSSNRKTQRTLKYTAKWKKPTEKATCYIIPTIWRSGKDKTMETIERSVVARNLGEGGGRDD